MFALLLSMTFILGAVCGAILIVVICLHMDAVVAEKRRTDSGIEESTMDRPFDPTILTYKD